jgi:hypothetical protein
MNYSRQQAMVQHATDKRIAIALLLLVAAYLLLIHWTALHGYLVSDSLSLLRACYLKAEDGTLLSWLLHLWVDGLPVQSHYYRPLSSASLCLDYALFGDNTMAWHSMQLFLHASNALLLFALARMLTQGLLWQNTASALAVLLFCVSPATPEVSVWVAGRYNVLALGWMLLAMILHGHGRYYWSLLMTMLALASKESALVLPVLLASISWWRYAIDAVPAPALQVRMVRCWKELWPTAVLVLGYLALRWHLFGDPLSVYVKTTSVADDFGWHWLQRLPVLVDILLPAWRELPHLQWLFLCLIGTAAGYALVHVLRSHAAHPAVWIRTWLLPGLWLLVSLLALLPHVQSASSAGAGSRLMYNAAAWLALLLALPLACGCLAARNCPVDAKASKAWGNARVALHAGLASVLALVMAWSQYPAQRDWSRATVYVDSLRVQLAQTAASMPAGEWGLLLVPDHLGMALVARNAQGALVTRPVQKEDILPRIIPFLNRDTDSWYQRLKNGELSWPDHAFCAHPLTAVLVPVNLPGRSASAQDWKALWREVMASPPCLGIDKLNLVESQQ